MHARLLEASPIVVIGMHRSGTRVVVDVLEKLGVFMGADTQGDSESVAFMLINEGILHQCGAFWSEPMADRAVFDRLVFPRLSAIAETGWTAPEHKSFARFAALCGLMPNLYGHWSR